MVLDRGVRMNERFMKNGVFSLEYDKETLRDMVLELQQENSQLKGSIRTYDILLKSNVEENKRLTQKITKALEKIEDYNLGKYDYSIPSIGVIELKEILEGKSK